MTVDAATTPSAVVERWFLSAEERGNPDSEIDVRHADGRAYTHGNHVRVLIDGAAYFGRLYEALNALEAGDDVLFTDWRGDGDERLAGAGTEVSAVLANLVRRGVKRPRVGMEIARRPIALQ